MYRVVRPLMTAFQYLNLALGTIGDTLQDIDDILHGDMHGTRAGDKNTAWHQEFNGEFVETLIGYQAFFSILEFFNESRRVENDDIILMMLLQKRFQCIESIVAYDFDLFGNMV